MGMGNITPLFYSPMQTADRNRLLITAEKEQLQVALIEAMLSYEKNGLTESGLTVEKMFREAAESSPLEISKIHPKSLLCATHVTLKLPSHE